MMSEPELLIKVPWFAKVPLMVMVDGAEKVAPCATVTEEDA